MTRSLIPALGLLLICPAAAGQRPGDEERLITVVKGTPAKDLDSALPKMRFERWLLDVVGKGVELRWEINDCGEQTGDPATDSKREIPVCVEAGADLPEGRAFGVQVSIGVTDKKPSKPKVWFIYVQMNRRAHSVERLRDLPAALAKKNP